MNMQFYHSVGECDVDDLATNRHLSWSLSSSPPSPSPSTPHPNDHFPVFNACDGGKRCKTSVPAGGHPLRIDLGCSGNSRQPPPTCAATAALTKGAAYNAPDPANSPLTDSKEVKKSAKGRRRRWRQRQNQLSERKSHSLRMNRQSVKLSVPPRAPDPDTSGLPAPGFAREEVIDIGRPCAGHEERWRIHIRDKLRRLRLARDHSTGSSSIWAHTSTPTGISSFWTHSNMSTGLASNRIEPDDQRELADRHEVADRREVADRPGGAHRHKLIDDTLYDKIKKGERTRSQRWPRSISKKKDLRYWRMMSPRMSLKSPTWKSRAFVSSRIHLSTRIVLRRLKSLGYKMSQFQCKTIAQLR